MRVVAGSHGGRRLSAPTGLDTRPTSDRVRGAVLNALEARGLVDGAVVVDLFAGSGALGIEALSRGAAAATFVESDRRAAACIRSNLSGLGLAGRVVVADVMAWLGEAPRFDLAFADPPYAFDRWDDLLGRLDAAVAVVESDREVAPPAPWVVVRARRYGTTVVTIAERHDRQPPPGPVPRSPAG